MNQPMQQRDDGLWEQAVPVPLYLRPFWLRRKRCTYPMPWANDHGCGRTFYRQAAYETHYRIEHTDGKVYHR